MKSNEFEGKKIFVTGAASGIGQAQATAFLERGAFVYGMDANPIGLELLAEAYPELFQFSTGSVSHPRDIETAVAQFIATHGTIDILCNTAGILDGFAKTLDTDEVLWNKVMDTNVKGLFLVTNAILPYMLKQKAGIVVNMASIAGLVGGGGGAAYTASKHAVIGYTKQLDLDYCRDGIRANAIAPGAIQTPMNAADFVGDGAIAKWVAEETPAGRWAQPVEVAKLTLYLASETSDYIHGAVIPIDGGWLAK